MPWFIDERDDEFCVVKGTEEEPLEVEKCHPTEGDAKAHLAALYASEEKAEEPGDAGDEEEKAIPEPDRFFVYKAADGSARWASISNVAIKDKEFEIVTEKAYDDAIEYARETGDFGEIDLVHVDGTDVGQCDVMMRAGKRLIEGGPFDDTDLARGAIKAVESDPDYWGVSIKFVYDPSKFDGEKYHGNIRIRKRTILPQEMAASFGTRFVAMNGGSKMKDELSDKARAVLAELNVSEDEIETLAEKQIEPEPNVVEKIETVEVRKSVWERLKEALLGAEEAEPEPDAETGGEEIVEEVEPAEVQEKQEDMTEAIKALTVAISTPLIEQIGVLATSIKAMESRLQEAEKAVEDKFLLKLAEVPPVVKVRASQVDATVQNQGVPTGPVFPNTAGQQAGYAAQLMAGVTDAVKAGINAALPDGKVQI